MIDILLQRGGSIDVRDSDGKTPVTIAAERCDGEMVRYLLAAQKASQHSDNLPQHRGQNAHSEPHEQRDSSQGHQLSFTQSSKRRLAYTAETALIPESYVSTPGASRRGMDTASASRKDAETFSMPGFKL